MFDGMGRSFTVVISLIVSGEVFANGLVNRIIPQADVLQGRNWGK
jgi:C4-dicarboxylate transporter